MSEIHRITVDPARVGGRQTVRSLRIRVKDILDLLASGAAHSEIVEDYPELEAEDIVAALEYVSRRSDHPIFSVA